MIFELNRGNNTDTSKEILEECKTVLLNGLMDNDEELRQNIFRFWADDKRLSIKCVDRLLILLDQLYSPDIESQFLGNLVSILLESCYSDLDYNQKIFQHPLHDCQFEDFNLISSWRAKNISNVPKYADTIASQLNYLNTLKYTENCIKQRFQIKKTMTLQFQPTMLQTQLDDNISTLEFNSQISINETNMSIINCINQQCSRENSGILF